MNTVSVFIYEILKKQNSGEENPNSGSPGVDRTGKLEKMWVDGNIYSVVYFFVKLYRIYFSSYILYLLKTLINNNCGHKR